jgi:hypothetical protein
MLRTNTFVVAGGHAMSAAEQYAKRNGIDVPFTPSKGSAEPRCSFEIADKIVTLLENDEEARCRWNTLLGRGIGAAMRDTFMSYRNRRRAEYVHNAATRALNARIDASFTPGWSQQTARTCAALSRARIVS